MLSESATNLRKKNIWTRKTVGGRTCGKMGTNGFFALCKKIEVSYPQVHVYFPISVYFNGVLVGLYLNHVRKKLYGVWEIVCLSHKQPSALVAPMLASLWKIKGTTNGRY